MKWITNYNHPEGLRFEIEQQVLRSTEDNREVDGFYFFVIDEKPAKSADYLQDTLELALEQANDEYGIPFDSWEMVES